MNLQSYNIGIIGCGHLGFAIARSLLINNLIEDSNLFLSCRGSKTSLERIREGNLSHRLFSNKEVVKRADILILSVKPQDIFELSRLNYGEETLILSFVAGVSESSLRKVLGNERVVRGIISGPDTIKARKAVVAVTQDCEQCIVNLLKPLSQIFYLLSERDINLVSSLVTLPGLLLMVDSKGRSDEVGAAIIDIEKKYKSKYLDPREIYHWALQLKPTFSSSDELEAYLSAMATKGGVTEAVIKEFVNGGSITSAIAQGEDRSRQISSEANKRVMSEA